MRFVQIFVLMIYLILGSIVVTLTASYELGFRSDFIYAVVFMTAAIVGFGSLVLKDRESARQPHEQTLVAIITAVVVVIYAGFGSIAVADFISGLLGSNILTIVISLIGASLLGSFGVGAILNSNQIQIVENPRS